MFADNTEIITQNKILEASVKDQQNSHDKLSLWFSKWKLSPRDSLDLEISLKMKQKYLFSKNPTLILNYQEIYCNHIVTVKINW